MCAPPEFRPRYWSLAEQRKATLPDNVQVLEALADQAVHNKNVESAAVAIRYLEDAIRHSATNPVDFEELAELLVAASRQGEAENVLRQGRQLDPYEAELYRLSTRIYLT